MGRVQSRIARIVWGLPVMTTKSAARVISLRRKRLFLNSIGFVVACVLVSSAYGISARAQQPVAFNIPSQDLNAAVLTFAQRAGVRVFYDTARLRGRQSQAISGAMSPQDALGRLLTGSGLTYRFTSPATVTIGTTQSLGAMDGPTSGTMLTTIDVQENGNRSEGYAATQSSSATKTDTPLIRTPASISVVTNQQIVDQNAQSISQALRYTPGVVAEQRGVNEESLEYLYSRGFQAETYLDGMRVPFTGFNIASRDTYLIDRIESIRGPASVLYGQSPPGGLVNIVSKMPLDTPFHELFVQSGSYGRAQAGFDFSGPLNDEKTLLYRITGVGLTTGTQTQFVDQQRIAIAPSFTWRPDVDTKLTVMANYQYDPEAGNFNYVPAVGTVLPGAIHIPRSFNTGDPGFDKFTKQEASFAYFFERRLNDTWEVKQNFRFLHNEQQIQHVGDGSSYVGASPPSTTLSRVAYNNFGTVNAVTLDNQAIATFDTGVLKHKALFGVDYQFTQYDHYLFYGIGGPGAPPLNIANPVYYQTIPTPSFMLGTSNKQGVEQLGIYAQDQMSIGKLTLVGGIRQDWASTVTVGYKDGIRTQQDDHALTGRGGVIYNFDNGIAPYFSYSTSFQPQGGTTTDGQALKPTEGKQYETGVKYQPVGSKSFFTASVFDLYQTNVKIQNGTIITQVGEVHSQGVELEAHAFVTDRWQVIASYTYNDLKNTNAAPANLGKVPAGIPAHMASLWTSYDMPDNVIPGLKVSAGTRFFGPTFGDAANTFKAPSYTLFDLGLQYDVGRQVQALKGVTANVNVSNLFDKTYATCTSLVYCTYGQGRLVLAGLKYRW